MSGYREALSAPGALRVFLPALLGRPSLAMITLILLYGRRTWRSGLVVRLLVCGATMIALSALAAALPGVSALAAGLALVGFFLAPSLVTGYLLADDLTAAEVRPVAPNG